MSTANTQHAAHPSLFTHCPQSDPAGSVAGGLQVPPPGASVYHRPSTFQPLTAPVAETLPEV